MCVVVWECVCRLATSSPFFSLKIRCKPLADLRAFLDEAQLATDIRPFPLDRACEVLDGADTDGDGLLDLQEFLLAVEQACSVEAEISAVAVAEGQWMADQNQRLEAQYQEPDSPADEGRQQKRERQDPRKQQSMLEG